MIIPEIVLSVSNSSQVSASCFQSLWDMSSENFVKGETIIGLQISLISGAMFRISFLSVEITPPDFGSSLEDIVPPVIMIATFGRFLFFSGSIFSVEVSLDVSKTLASNISDSLIPML